MKTPRFEVHDGGRDVLLVDNITGHVLMCVDKKYDASVESACKRLNRKEKELCVAKTCSPWAGL